MYEWTLQLSFIKATAHLLTDPFLLIIPVLDVGAAAEGKGVKRKRCTWPFGIDACMSCCPGPGMTVTP